MIQLPGVTLINYKGDNVPKYVSLTVTGWLISSLTSFIRYKISYTQTIIVIRVYRDCNSNILNDFKRYF